MPDIKEKKIINKLCLISFSNNADHQNVIYSMYKALKNQTEVYTIGIMNPKSKSATFDDHNIYCNCPERPGIGKGTFRVDVLLSPPAPRSLPPSAPAAIPLAYNSSMLLVDTAEPVCRFNFHVWSSIRPKSSRCVLSSVCQDRA